MTETDAQSRREPQDSQTSRAACVNDTEGKISRRSLTQMVWIVVDRQLGVPAEAVLCDSCCPAGVVIIEHVGM
jgi:hypothetical protein